jgi:hypothetical protein
LRLEKLFLGNKNTNTTINKSKNISGFLIYFNMLILLFTNEAENSNFK